eukprot:TRINITY_DN106652_c0_g1_i1.p3 TRINITY_DN106652_c0_g1~~TRINITY_DN106652_c0_g1_i1.p3  ORF type:complete len:114 (+),score=10.44 TRINITY_DN106652_c0_g1_i1:25-366(+)
MSLTNPASCEGAERTVQEGWLDKKGAGMFGGWKTRWFQLDKPDKALYWYEGSEAQDPKGGFIVKGTEAIAKDDRLWTITGKGLDREYELKCASKRVLEEWVCSYNEFVESVTD